MEKLKEKKYIWITTSAEGFHKYPAALTDPKLATGDDFDVSFLGHVHRHMFYYKVYVEIFHDDRDLEFIQVKRQVEEWVRGEKFKYNMSCEMLADQLYQRISNYWPGRDVIIEVSEDNENGCRCEYIEKGRYGH